MLCYRYFFFRKSLCSNPRCKPTWVTSSWSVCSQSCGKTGIKTRIVNCVYQGRKRQPAGNQCSNHGVPAITLPCNRRPCLSKGKNEYQDCVLAYCIPLWVKRCAKNNLFDYSPTRTRVSFTSRFYGLVSVCHQSDGQIFYKIFP